MVRDLRRLADDTFDLLVVGAGIYGALAAWDAARRGLRVAVLDRSDFGGATSFNSHKTLHGGLRSLQSLSLPQMRLFIRERRAMARMVPHLLRPLPFCVPTSGHLTRSALALRAALAATDAVGSDRNAGIDDEALHLPGGRIVSREECVTLNPLVDPAGVTGGAVWFDYQMRQAERVVFAAVESAVGGGAVAANHVEVVAAVRSGRQIAGVTVEDRLSGERFDVRATVVLNAAGPWAGALLTRLAGRPAALPAARLSRAMNLVVDGLPTTSHACGGMVDGRFLFVVPWRDVSIVGTSHDAHDADADAPHGTPDHVAALRADAARAFPRAAFDRIRVRLVHRGLLPMVSGHGAHVGLLKESQVVDHAADGHPGMVSIFSVRYTTARHTAEAAVDAVVRRLARTVPAGSTATARVDSANFTTVATLLDEAAATVVSGTDAAFRRRLAGTYGSGWREVASLASQPGLGLPLGPGCQVTSAEIVHAVQRESAVTLADAVLRRTEAGTAGHPGRTVLEAAAALMALALGWDDARKAREVAAVDALYPAG